jgi:hypothetical protein
MLTSNDDDENKNKGTASPSPASQNAVKPHYAINEPEKKKNNLLQGI